MLRDERLQKVVADIDGAADRERVSGLTLCAAARGAGAAMHGKHGVIRPAGSLHMQGTPVSPSPPPHHARTRGHCLPQALLRALQAPNFREFADRVSVRGPRGDA